MIYFRASDPLYTLLIMGFMVILGFRPIVFFSRQKLSRHYSVRSITGSFEILAFFNMLRAKTNTNHVPRYAAKIGEAL